MKISWLLMLSLSMMIITSHAVDIKHRSTGNYYQPKIVPLPDLLDELSLPLTPPHPLDLASLLAQVPRFADVTNDTSSSSKSDANNSNNTTVVNDSKPNVSSNSTVVSAPPATTSPTNTTINSQNNTVSQVSSSLTTTTPIKTTTSLSSTSSISSSSSSSSSVSPTTWKQSPFDIKDTLQTNEKPHTVFASDGDDPQDEQTKAAAESKMIEEALQKIKSQIVDHAQNIKAEKKWVKQVTQIIEIYADKTRLVNSNIRQLQNDVYNLFRQKKQIENMIYQRSLQHKIKTATTELSLLSSALRKVEKRNDMFDTNRSQLKKSISAMEKELAKLEQGDDKKSDDKKSDDKKSDDKKSDDKKSDDKKSDDKKNNE